MIKYVIREVPAEWAEFRDYFDGDGLTDRSGDYCNNLFIIDRDGWRNYSGFNIDEFKRVQKRAEDIIEEFECLRGEGWTDGSYNSFKECMVDCGIPYNPRKCHALKEWAIDADADNPKVIAEFLTLTTGKAWRVSSAYGHNRGDHVQVIYCDGHYTEKGAIAAGEIYLGAATEFCVIEVSDYQKADGGEEPTYTELDSCYGYFVADSEAWEAEDYKRIVCDGADISADEAQIELIDRYTTRTIYNYRVA